MRDIEKKGMKGSKKEEERANIKKKKVKKKGN